MYCACAVKGTSRIRTIMSQYLAFILCFPEIRRMLNSFLHCAFNACAGRGTKINLLFDNQKFPLRTRFTGKRVLTVTFYQQCAVALYVVDACAVRGT